MNTLYTFISLFFFVLSMALLILQIPFQVVSNVLLILGSYCVHNARWWIKPQKKGTPQ